MGRIFLERMDGGTRLYSCRTCDAALTNEDKLQSKEFKGSTGRAYLFSRVINLKYSEPKSRVMLTGAHIVRDVFCKGCNAKLGWAYEFATRKEQEYKEGQVILERALISVTANDDIEIDEEEEEFEEEDD